MSDEAQVPQWSIRTLTEAYKPRPPTEYIVDNIFATYGLYIVFGSPASMKSMLMAALCGAVVSGKRWLPGIGDHNAGIGVTRSPAFWVDMDNGQRRTDARFEAIGRAYKLPEDAPLYYVSMPNPALIAHDLEPMAILQDYIIQFGARLVVVDNLGLITGDVEENSAMMATVMGNLRFLAERTGAAVIVIHHQRKGGYASGGRAGESLRGHSSIEAAVDAAIRIIRDGESTEVVLKGTKSRDIPVPPMGARFNFTHKPGTTDLETAWFDGVTIKRGENAIGEVILEQVDYQGSVGKTKLAQDVYDELGPDVAGINKIRAWIDNMLGKGELLESPNGKYKLISLPQE